MVPSCLKHEFCFIYVCVEANASYNLTRLHSSNVNRDLIKENKFKLKKKKKARNTLYPAETMTNADYADDLAFLANSPALAESLLQSLEQAAKVSIYLSIYLFSY